MFQRAERKAAKLKLAITGPSGSGKTYSALRLAKGLGGKVAVIDTEMGSASLYSDLFEFDVIDLKPPFLSQKYMDLIDLAVKHKYDVLIIDSITHQWNSEGGVMDRKDKESLARPGVNSYTLWTKYTPEHESFKQKILQAPIHIIATMRSKQDYVMEANDKGKQAPRKVGLAPIQREGIEYEFTTVFDIAMNHQAIVSKDRTNLFDGRIFQINEETGEKMNEWLNSAKPIPAAIKVYCQCGEFLTMHESRKGYLCPKYSKQTPDHLKLSLEEYEQRILDLEKAQSLKVEVIEDSAPDSFSNFK